MKCQNCQKRDATENWVGNGGMMDFVHGNYQRWCKVCVLKTQIKHLKQQVRRLPILEAKLKKLDK